MTFEPQVPDWGKKLVAQNLDQLVIYHDWLCNTGIKSGLISPKSKQFVWDEFVVHSLYFGKIISELQGKVDVISDLGTGGGIPGIPIGITTNLKVNLIDVKEKRIFELSRLIKILNNNNIFAIQDDAYNYIKKGGFLVSRCFISSKKVINSLETNKNTTYLVSSNGEDLDYDSNVFHVKHENFKINKDDIRHIDVINVK
ncbi:MAG: class I SAM-dependent methyltransferase [Candidatus Actinomarina sp.]|jgi:16S rRNA G527 N7-methylase RsmG|nr:class I SAM-dependent methyltransferase [Candidatus Actinomarina sp.]MBL6762734.1 class I SAM-dependent methyltransferase [Candidatus Actinomarina sp.]MBL6836132.1 class I SAM-dependent methyltransferase [Candidatus Actinomarina sp.]